MSTDAVQIWEETVIIPTYKAGKPDKNPMFLEKRVYQGSSGVVYPLPVIETIENEKKDADYQVVFLENKYLKVMVMPCLGGRVQMLYDKTQDFHAVYYNHVIKPALVGLTGPWIAGGIEFNWPQHHRPSTFDPVDYSIEEHPDGSKTLWVSEIERISRTKGTAGFTLHPQKAFLEIKVHLYNRTPVPQTFMWWANPAMAVNDDYQSIFPPDVHAVFDHGKRDVSRFPIATGEYYKIDYSAGVDISRFKNIPVPTSFMAASSKYDFMGGYDHGRRAGMLHFADHHISPGKKQWVWGCGDFGDAWHRNLTDEDGPYVELMTGVFTDNQPDFSWLMPFEEKMFSQYFFPYKIIGRVKNANNLAAVNLEIQDGQIYIGVYVTTPRTGLKIELSDSKKTYLEATQDLDPSQAFEKTIALDQDTDASMLSLRVYSAEDQLLVSCQPEPEKVEKIPEPAQPIQEPDKIRTIEELFLAGLHLEQYRHATRRPELYYQEALKRDPDDIRCNNAMGLLLYRQGRFELAEKYFRAAVKNQTRHNPNPYDGEPYYNLGLCLKIQNRLDEAYDAFYKAAWNAAVQDAAYFALAQIASIRGNYTQALEHIDKSLFRNSQNHNARHLKTILLRTTGQFDVARQEAILLLNQNKLDFGAMFELYLLDKLQKKNRKAEQKLKEFKLKMRDSVHNYLEISLDYANAGFIDNTVEILQLALEATSSEQNVFPMVYYYLAAMGQEDYLEKAAAANPDYCFPHRLESLPILQHCLKKNPRDAKGWYYLGNFWYSKWQYDLAIEAWVTSTELDEAFPTVHRNLGLAYYNKKHDSSKARRAYEKAYSLDCSDARILFELDQLYKKMAKSPLERLTFLQLHPQVLEQRDDLYVEYIWLLNLTGDYRQALQRMQQRIFHPWEGGEGKVTGAYVFSLVKIAEKQIRNKEYQEVIQTLSKTEKFPENLGEGKLYGRRENDIHYLRGLAYEGLGQIENADESFKKATEDLKDLGNATYYYDQPPEQIFYQGLALVKLGQNAKARGCFNRLLSYGRDHYYDEVKIDYFAVSLPDFLIFDEDLTLKNKLHCQYLMGLGRLGLGQSEKARQDLETVLSIDPAHVGAVRHLNWINCREVMNGTGRL